MIIHYETIIADYLSGLNTQLRKFSPAEEFLSMWVHDEDNGRSIYNMAEAAELYGLPSLSIAISSSQVVESLDEDQLIRQLNQMGSASLRREKADGLIIDIHFKRESRLSLACLEIADAPLMYRLSLSRLTPIKSFEIPLERNLRDVVLKASLSGVSLEAHVNPNSHVISQLYFSGSTTSVSKSLMNKLCELMMNKPVNECYDHAIVSLEYSLRESPHTRPHSGITLPCNGWRLFKDASDLVRGLCRNYYAQTGYHDRQNFYSPPMSPQWLAKSDLEKRESLEEVIRQFCEDRNIDPGSVIVKEIQRSHKIILQLDPASFDDATVLLMDMEVCLRQKLEGALCVHAEEEPDRNKMRWDRPAVKSQAPKPRLVFAKGG